ADGFAARHLEADALEHMDRRSALSESERHVLQFDDGFCHGVRSYMVAAGPQHMGWNQWRSNSSSPRFCWWLPLSRRPPGRPRPIPTESWPLVTALWPATASARANPFLRGLNRP